MNQVLVFLDGLLTLIIKNRILFPSISFLSPFPRSKGEKWEIFTPVFNKDPDFPKKSKNMTAEEYQDILRKYYGSKDRRKMKQKRRNRLNNKLNKLIEDGGSFVI